MAALITNERAVALVPQLASVSSDQLTAQLDSASKIIEAACGRKFACGFVVEEPVLTDVYGYAWIQRSPVMSGTLTLTDLDNVAVNRWRLDTESGELWVPSYPARHLKATYQGGFDPLPAELELAVANFARINIVRQSSQADGEIESKKIGSVEITYASPSSGISVQSVPKAVMDTIGHLVMPKLV